jgi:hypothetical protein
MSNAMPIWNVQRIDCAVKVDRRAWATARVRYCASHRASESRFATPTITGSRLQFLIVRTSQDPLTLTNAANVCGYDTAADDHCSHRVLGGSSAEGGACSDPLVALRYQ